MHLPTADERRFENEDYTDLLKKPMQYWKRLTLFNKSYFRWAKLNLCFIIGQANQYPV